MKKNGSLQDALTGEQFTVVQRGRGVAEIEAPANRALVLVPVARS